MDQLHLRMLAKNRYGPKKGKCTNNLPCKDWALSFLNKYKIEVAIRVAANINKSRANLSRKPLRKYFPNLKKRLPIFSVIVKSIKFRCRTVKVALNKK